MEHWVFVVSILGFWCLYGTIISLIFSFSIEKIGRGLTNNKELGLHNFISCTCCIFVAVITVLLSIPLDNYEDYDDKGARRLITLMGLILITPIFHYIFAKCNYKENLRSEKSIKYSHCYGTCEGYYQA